MTRTAAQLLRPGSATVRVLARTPRLTVMGWHRISDDGTDLSTSLDDFRAHLDVLEEWGAQVLPLAEAVRRLRQGCLPDRAVALTFDDGYASVIELAWPELHERGLPATLFAVSGYLDGSPRFPWDDHHPDDGAIRLADRAMLREAAAGGLDIGSHTVTHRRLPEISPAEVRHEVHDSRAQLEDLLQAPVRSFAYPVGRWNEAIRDEVERAGYDVAVTVDRGRNGDHAHPLSLSRAFAFDRPGDFQMQLNGAYTWLRPIETWRATGRLR